LNIHKNSHIVEGCLYIESKKLGYNFMKEIEKGNNENRKIA